MENRRVSRGDLLLFGPADVDHRSIERVVADEAEVERVPAVGAPGRRYRRGHVGGGLVIIPSDHHSSDAAVVGGGWASPRSGRGPEAADCSALRHVVKVADLSKWTVDVLVKNAIGASASERQIVGIGAVAAVKISADPVLDDRPAEKKIGLGTGGGNGSRPLVVLNSASFGHQTGASPAGEKVHISPLPQAGVRA